VLSGKTFPIGAGISDAKLLIRTPLPSVFLDECSQVIEPLSLLPLRLGASRLLAVGDPLQLPPTLLNYQECMHVSRRWPLMRSSAADPQDLGRTLFSRLSDAGFPTVLLRTQYRYGLQVFNGYN
jgi:superfamily I DNA and/or RNA helicase